MPTWGIIVLCVILLIVIFSVIYFPLCNNSNNWCKKWTNLCPYVSIPNQNNCDCPNNNGVPYYNNLTQCWVEIGCNMSKTCPAGSYLAHSECGGCSCKPGIAPSYQ